MTAKHTPTPWRDNGYTAHEEYNKACAVWTADSGTFICATSRGEKRKHDADEDTQDANARFIAHACNAHDELLTALREAENVIRWAAQEAAGRVKAEIVNGWTHHADKFRAAIAKAEGTQP